MASRAQQTVTVNFQAKGERQLTNAIMLLDKASKSLTMTQTLLIKNSKKYTSEQRRQRKSTRILGGTFATIRSKMLLFNFAMALGVRQLGRFAVQASKVESMGRAFGTLVGSTEGTRASLEKLKNATNDTMSEFDLFQQANNAMVLGVSKNSDEMAEMFDIAQRLGRALGRDTASSVESLVTGIGRQSRLMLDNIGIIVKSDKAYESYAKKLGINVEQLTDAEKKQAFLTATMESARAKVKTLGDETLTTQDIYDKLSSSSADLASATGNLLAPLMTTMASVFTSLADSATGYFNSITLARKPITEFTSSEEAMLILLARRTKALKEIDAFDRRSSRDKMDALDVQKNNKEKLAEIDKKLLDLNLGNIQAVVDANEAQKNKNKTDLDATITGLYRIEIAQQELDILRNRNEAMLGGMSIQEELNLIDDQKILNQLKKNNGDITEQEFRKKNLELIGKEMTLEEKLGKVKLETVSNTIGALSELAKSSQATFELGKALALAQAIIDTYGAGNKVLNSDLEFPFNVIAMTGVIATGLKNVAQIRSQKFEQGGLVGGRRHSQGGTMIEAERGEFVMSRNAVDSIGINNLEQMNQGSGGGITLNISAPLVDETVIDTIIPAIEKAQRMNLA
tara:strand:+ start:101 stop:1981 length:1881 start_codon:yes stop_codon:yes gene_type:complete